MRLTVTRCPPIWSINTIITSTAALRRTRAVSGHLLRRYLLLDRAVQQGPAPTENLGSGVTEVRGTGLESDPPNEEWSAGWRDPGSGGPARRPGRMGSHGATQCGFPLGGQRESQHAPGLGHSPCRR